MNSVIKAAIEFAREYNYPYDEKYGVAEVEESIAIWDDLTDGQKFEALEYVFKNENDEDFGHSGCCKAIHQATAYYCVCLLREVDSGDLFDDLDFMMAESIRSNPEVQKLFGISQDF